MNNSEYDGVIARYCGYIEPMNGIYSVKLVSHLEQMLKDNVFKLKSIIHENNFHILEESCVMKLIDKKNIKYSLMIIAILFHKSVLLLAIPILILDIFSIRFKHLLIFWILSSVLSYILAGKYLHYFEFLSFFSKRY